MFFGCGLQTGFRVNWKISVYFIDLWTLRLTIPEVQYVSMHRYVWCIIVTGRSVVHGQMTEMAAPLRSEDELGRKWDRCLSDTAIKTGKYQLISVDITRSFQLNFVYESCLFVCIVLQMPTVQARLDLAALLLTFSAAPLDLFGCHTYFIYR